MPESAVRPERVALSETAAQILDVAEHLFAERGVDKVSLREIVRACGQSNSSAAHYHFGSRSALIGELLARRVRAINVIRHQRLDVLVAQGLHTSVYSVVTMTVQVLGEVVRTTPWGRDYVRVMSEMLTERDAEVWTHLDPDTMSGHTRVRDTLRRLLPELPARVFKDRLWLLNNVTTYSMARWVDAYGPVTASNTRRFTALLRNTAEFLAAGMAAPVGSPEAHPESIPGGTA